MPKLLLRAFVFSCLLLSVSLLPAWASFAQAAPAIKMAGIYDLGSREGSPVAVEAGRLYILRSGHLAGYSLKDEKEVWRKRLPDFLDGSFLLSGGRVVVALSDGYMAAYCQLDGQVIWQRKQASFLKVHTLSQSPASGYVLVETVDGALLCLDCFGNTVWRYSDPSLAVESLVQEVGIPLERHVVSTDLVLGGAVNSPLDGDRSGLFLLAASDGRLLALRGDNGELVWQQMVSRPDIERSDVNIVRILASPVFVPELGAVVTVSRVGPMEARDGRTGRLLWRFGISGVQPPVLWRNHLYVVSSGGKLIAVDARSGEKDWSVFINSALNNPQHEAGFWYGPVLLPPKDGNDEDTPSLLLASNEGSLAIFDLQGRCLALYDMRYPAWRAPTVVSGSIYQVVRNGNLLALSF